MDNVFKLRSSDLRLTELIEKIVKDFKTKNHQQIINIE